MFSVSFFLLRSHGSRKSFVWRLLSGIIGVQSPLLPRRLKILTYTRQIHRGIIIQRFILKYSLCNVPPEFAHSWSHSSEWYSRSPVSASQTRFWTRTPHLFHQPPDRLGSTCPQTTLYHPSSSIWAPSVSILRSADLFRLLHSSGNLHD